MRRDITGQTFSHLKAIRPTGKKSGRAVYWLFECLRCGGEAEILRGHVTSGRQQSCGCLLRDNRNSRHFAWKGVGQLSGSVYYRAKRAAEERGLTFNVSIEHLWELFQAQNGRCALSGFPIEFSDVTTKGGTASLDRICSDEGYEPGNIQWVHKDVNLMKNHFPEDYFVKVCKAVAASHQ